MRIEKVDEIITRLRSGPADTTSLRSVRRQVSREIHDLDRAAVLSIAGELIRRAPFARSVAYELVQNHAPTMRFITRREVEALGEGLGSWVDVDTFACYVAGLAWREGRITDACIEEWSRSPDRWWRRAALVCTIPLNIRAQGGTGDTARTLAICGRLTGDRDDMVVKALSWALRALSVHDPHAVQGFMSEHEHELAPRVLREVRNKLTTGLKNPALKATRKQ